MYVSSHFSKHSRTKSSEQTSKKMDPAEILISQESLSDSNQTSTHQEPITNPPKKTNFSNLEFGDPSFGEHCKSLTAKTRLINLKNHIREAVSEGEFELPLQPEIFIPSDHNTIWILNEHIDILKKSNLQVHEIGTGYNGGKECWISWYPVDPMEQIFPHGTVELHPAEKTILKMNSKKRKKNPLTRNS